LIPKGQVAAPEFGRVWINSGELTLADLRGRVALIDFWDYTCVNCLRTLPYVKEWHRRYKDNGLVVVGVHAPEFSFAHNVENVRRAVAKARPGACWPEVWNRSRGPAHLPVRQPGSAPPTGRRTDSRGRRSWPLASRAKGCSTGSRLCSKRSRPAPGRS